MKKSTPRKKWLRENRAAFAAYNERLAKHGLFNELQPPPDAKRQIGVAYDAGEVVDYFNVRGEDRRASRARGKRIRSTKRYSAVKCSVRDADGAVLCSCRNAATARRIADALNSTEDARRRGPHSLMIRPHRMNGVPRRKFAPRAEIAEAAACAPRVGAKRFRADIDAYATALEKHVGPPTPRQRARAEVLAQRIALRSRQRKKPTRRRGLGSVMIRPHRLRGVKVEWPDAPLSDNIPRKELFSLRRHFDQRLASLKQPDVAKKLRTAIKSRPRKKRNT